MDEESCQAAVVQRGKTKNQVKGGRRPQQALQAKTMVASEAPSPHWSVSSSSPDPLSPSLVDPDLLSLLQGCWGWISGN